MPDTAFTDLPAERLVLRRFRPADAPAFAAYRSDPTIARCQSWQAPYPLERAESMTAELATANQGRGYATKAVRRLLGYLFTERGKHRVTANCDERNVRSAALLRRVGMRREGLLVESTWAKGEWTNDELYAVLRREWLDPRQGAGPRIRDRGE
jgi:aminoglycoside 6'-N-acetyltransferase